MKLEVANPLADILTDEEYKVAKRFIRKVALRNYVIVRDFKNLRKKKPQIFLSSIYQELAVKGLKADSLRRVVNARVPKKK